MNWTYINPFWQRDDLMHSKLSPDECRQRLKDAGRDVGSVVQREWLARGDATFHKPGYRLGPLFEVHVRVSVLPAEGGSSRLHLRFSGGIGTAIAQILIAVVCLAAFLWAVTQLVGGGAWNPGYGAGLLAIVIPVLLVLALRSSAPGDEDDLWQFVADQVEGERSP